MTARRLHPGSDGLAGELQGAAVSALAVVLLSGAMALLGWLVAR
jgi:hypothetical protein